MLRVLIALFAIIGASLPVAAQDYPTHPISVVVPFPPGGPADVLVRMVQGKMEAALGQSLVVDNGSSRF
jgi:tripartite-type tricarboxylate transporter receptor subunit TctC